MNIFFLTSWFPNRIHRNHGNFVARHARLVARDHQVTVVAVQEDPGLSLAKLEVVEAIEDGYQVIRVYVGQPANTPGLARPAIRWNAYLRGVNRAKELSGNADLLHGHALLDGGIMAAWYGLLWRVPYLITEHSSHYHHADALPGLRGKLGRWACRRASVVMPVSKHLERSMRLLNKLDGRYRVVSNVVSVDTFNYKPPPKNGPFRLLHVSDFNEGPKNIRGLLRAYARVRQRADRPVVIHFAGDGDQEVLRQKIEVAGAENVTFSGPHTETEIARQMQACHAFILFSNYENQPVVLLEAQVCGRPCLATPVGGIPDIIVEGETGLLSPLGDEAAMACAIERMRDEYAGFNPQQIRRRAIGLYGEAAVRRALAEEYQRAFLTHKNHPYPPQRGR